MNQKSATSRDWRRFLGTRFLFFIFSAFLGYMGHSLTHNQQHDSSPKIESLQKQDSMGFQKYALTGWFPNRRDSQGTNFSNIETLPYLAGYKKSSKTKNVTIYDEESAEPGLNFYISGSGPDAFLIDMKGTVLYEWHYPITNVWPDYPLDKVKYGEHPTFWRRAHLFSNGDILAIFNGIGLIKLNKESELLWAKRIWCHHDLFVADNRDIYILTAERAVIPWINKTHYVLEDFITVLDENGNVKRKISIVNCFFNSEYTSMIYGCTIYGDVFHTNTLEVFDGSLEEKSPLFKKGNYLISILVLSAIAIIDPEQEKVVWAMSGMWKHQHQPVLLSDGNMLVFNNKQNNGMSEVLEFNPFTQHVVWKYSGRPSNGFVSLTMGSNQRLPGGNTLITESEAGRVFEVTKEKKIVWEFLNPHRAGDNNSLIATIFDMVRIFPSSDFFISGSD